jgi:hypothetical protein
VPLYIGSKINTAGRGIPAHQRDGDHRVCRTRGSIATSARSERALPAMGNDRAADADAQRRRHIATSQAARENPGTMLLSGPAGPA